MRVKMTLRQQHRFHRCKKRTLRFLSDLAGAIFVDWLLGGFEAELREEKKRQWSTAEKAARAAKARREAHKRWRAWLEYLKRQHIERPLGPDETYIIREDGEIVGIRKVSPQSREEGKDNTTNQE